jgi:hypothetical protein
MFQRSCNRDMQDQGWYSGLVTEICRIRDDKMVWCQSYAGPGMLQWSGNRDMQDQG